MDAISGSFMADVCDKELSIILRGRVEMVCLYIQNIRLEPVVFQEK
jgi:hypothetical protein